MKKRLHNIQLFITITCLSMLGASFISVHAEEDVEDSDKITLNTIDKYKDVIRGSGYEDWQPDYNPKLREMYGGYNRNGSFYIWKQSTNEVFMATNLNVKWKPGGGVTLHYFIPGVGTIEKSEDYQVRELSDVSGLFELKRDCDVWKHPTSTTQATGETLPKGTYAITRQALEYVELVKPDGAKVWVSPQYSNKDQATFFTDNYGKFTDAKDTLSVNSVNGKPIKQWFMPVRIDKRTGMSMQPKYVTIHNTGSPGNGANAYVHAKNQISDSRTWVSWHYTVDNNEIYQSIPMSEIAYHAGDGQNIGNSATIGIEICENADGNYAQAERNAAYLTAQILFENNLPADAVRMHKDWSGKQCAKNILEGTKGTMGWNGFKNLVKQEYERLVILNGVDKTIPAGFESFITTSAVQFDNGLTQGYELGSNVQKTIDTLKAVDASAQVEVYKNGSLVTPTSKIATGQQVRITKGDQVFRFMIVVKGDTNGDGEILTNDYFIIKKYKEKDYDLNGPYLKAADIDGNKSILTNDYFMIKKYKEGSYEIIQ